MTSKIFDFLGLNPEVKLINADFFSKEKIAQYNWPTDTDQKQLLQQLRTRQRLLKVYPDENVAAALEGLGFHSAHHIASLDADDFAQKTVPALSGITGVSDPAALSAKIAGNASRIRRSSFELALAQPRTMELDAVTPSANDQKPDFQQGIPDYQRLFGPMITCDCDECQSIFGPAAYFTDLMRVVTTYVTPPLEELFTLQYRRPDLWTLPLDCKTAETEVRYLDIVNAILQQNLQVNFTAGTDPMQVIAGSVYPFNAPFNVSLLTIRSAMERLGVPLSTVYKLLETIPPAAAAEKLQLSPEQLALVKGATTYTLAERYGITGTPTDTELCTQLSQQANFLQQTGLVPDELEQLTYQNLKRGTGGYAMYDSGSRDISTESFENDALSQSLTIELWIFPTRITGGTVSIIGKGTGQEFFLSLIDQGNVKCTYIDAGGNIIPIQSSRTLTLNTWTHIAYTRHYSTGEHYIYINGVNDSGYQITAGVASQYSNSAIEIGYDGGSSYAGALSEIRIWTRARTEAQIKSMMFSRLKNYNEEHLFCYWPMNETGGDVAHDLAKHHYDASRGDSIYFALYESLPIGDVSEMNPTLLHGLYLNSVLSSSTYIQLTAKSFDSASNTLTPAALALSDGVTGNTPAGENTLLNDAALNQLAVLIRLKAQTGWSYDELDWALKTINGSTTPVTNDMIVSLGKIAELTTQYKIRVDELCSFWHDMKTYGRGNGSEPQDLWDRVYNTPPLMHDSGTVTEQSYYRPIYTSNPLFMSAVITWTFKGSTYSQDQRISNQLAAALGISAADLAAIAGSVTTASSVSLSVANLSLFYRIARFAKMLDMPVTDFISLTQVAGAGLSMTSPGTSVWTISQVETLCSYRQWLRKSGLRISQVAWLTGNSTSTAGLGFPDQAVTDKALNSMIQAAAQTLITPDSFMNPEVDDATAQGIFDQLVNQKMIDKNGLVLNGTPLTLMNVYKALSENNTALATKIIHGGPASSVINFNPGNSDNVEISFDPFGDATIQSANSFTMSCWIKPVSNITEGWPRIVGNTQSGSDNNTGKSPSFVQTQNESTAMQVVYSTKEGVFEVRVADGIFNVPEEWVFLSWVNDGGTWTLYRNGIAVPFTDSSATGFPAPFKQTTNTPTYFIATAFKGSVSNLAIWNVARTPAQVQQDMFTQFTGTESGLIGYWPVNEGQGNVIYDYVTYNGHTYNGAFTNIKNNTPVWVANSGLTEVSRILKVLEDALDAQTTLAIKTLAGLSGLSQETMAGVCSFSSGELNNASALGVTGQVPYAPNLIINPDADTNPNRNDYLQLVQYNSALARWFKLTGEEISKIALYATKFSTVTPSPFSFGSHLFTLHQLQELSDYKSLQQLCNQVNGLIGYFEKAPAITASSHLQPTDEQLTLLAELTGWDYNELKLITSSHCFNTVNFNIVSGVRKIADVMRAEDKTGMGMNTLLLLQQLSAQNCFSPGTTTWQTFDNAVAATNAALTSKQGADAVTENNGSVRMLVRDVLCNWLIWLLEPAVSGVQNREALYEYLLIDVNMSPDVKTSWTVTAMNSLQLYVNRIINNLESGVVNNIPQAWWKWMSTYRVWQANREVYLYPENYVDPSLRRYQSDAFRQLINDLSQNQVTDENVRAAMANYLELVSDVASLQLVDACMVDLPDNVPGMNPDNQRRVINMIGRSQTSPAVFYSRTALFVTSKTAVNNEHVEPSDATSVDFGPWEKIGLSINSDYVTTATAFGRQFIFWVEQTQITNTNGITTNTSSQTISTEDSSKSDSKKYTATYCTIYYSWRDFNSSWIEPSILKKDILIGVTGDGTSYLDFYPGCLYGSQMVHADNKTQYPYHKDRCWNKVNVLPLSQTSGVGEALVVVLGPYVTCDLTVADPPQRPKKKMNEAAYQLQGQLLAAATYSYNHKDKEKPTYTTVVPATLLTASFTTRDYFLRIDTTGANFVAGTLIKENDAQGLLFDVSSSLLNIDLPQAYSWWPCTKTDNYATATSATDVISGNNATVSSSIVWSDTFTNLPGISVPNLTGGTIQMDWGSNKKQKYSTLSFWICLGSDLAPGSTIFNSTNYDNGGNYLLGMTYETDTSVSPQTQVFYAYYNTHSSSHNTYRVKSSPVTKGTWYYITISVSKSEVEIYLNGLALRLSENNKTFSVTTNTSLTFQQHNYSIFNLLYHRIALTPAEALVLYQQAFGYLYLSNLHLTSTSFNRIGNSAGAFVFNAGTQSYLVLPDALNNTITDCMHASAGNTALHLSFKKSPLVSPALPKMRFVRVNTDTVAQMITVLARAGFDGLYAPAMQQLGEQSLHKYNPTTYSELPDSDLMNFNGAFSIYFWEIFFYAPYLIAEQLRTGNKFDAAEKWYQRIFNPTSVQPNAGEEWFDFITNPENEPGPVAYWPINKNTGAAPAITFPSVISGTADYALTGTNVTAVSADNLPFAFLDRSTWTFNAGTNPSKAVLSSCKDDLNTATFTITAWVKLTALPSDNSTVVVSQARNNYGYHLQFVKSNNNWCLRLIVYAKLNDAVINFVSADSYTSNTLNEWMFVAGRYNGEKLDVYINGKKVTQNPGSVTGFKQNTSGPFCVGCGNSAGTDGSYFNGIIADVAYFNYAKKSSAIKKMYQSYLTVGPNAAFWNFMPFRRINATSLYHILNGDAWQESFLQPAAYYTASMQMAIYEYDPFDPDTIARLRVNSWQKATFMRYIENLINWGDSLFTQDTWESLSDATMRYVLAETLLGRKPVKTVVEDPQPAINYNAIELEYGSAGVPQFLIEMENGLSGFTTDDPPTLPQQVQSIVDAYYCIPSNKQLLNYWQVVADRLYKLRHGLTITGAPNTIPLFAAPADPRGLMRTGNANSLADVTVNAHTPAVPWFRFSYLINQAKSVTAEVSRLGGELLAALEKKDAEHLSQLQAGYQQIIFNMTNQVKAAQVNQLQYVGEGLQASYENAKYVHNTYLGWMADPIGPLEALSLFMSAEAAAGSFIANAVRIPAIPAYLLPDIYGLADGGMNFGEAIDAAARLIEGDANLATAASHMLQQMAQYVRRELEWDLQKNIAGNQMKEIQAQIAANNFALEAATREAEINQVQLEQAQEVYQFLKTKFTNEELYSWMSGQLNTLYFQMFQLAWSLAQSAQSALQYELNLNQSYLNNAAWNASYQGLLAGDALSLALQQMENAYISGNNRKLEIRKTWSMRQNNPQALLTLVSTGNCRFDINELSYDLDFPGHYNRKIKSLSVTIPAVVGPYQNIHASLTQTGNAVVVKPSVNAVNYLLGLSNNSLPSDGSLRVNWNPNQEIIISTGVNDAGMFQVNFNDEQYLPFEGTGAVSSWNLSIPQAANAFDLRSISDVIITVEYTAEDGGATFRSQVTALDPVKNYNGWQYLSMRQVFGAAWFNFCTNPVITTDPVATTYSLSFELVKQMYPANLSDVMLGNANRETGIYFVTAAGISVSDMKLNMNDGATGTCPLPGNLLEIKHTDSDNNDTGPVPLPGKGNPWTLHVTTAPADIITDGKIDQTKLLDIILVMPFNGTLSW